MAKRTALPLAITAAIAATLIAFFAIQSSAASQSDAAEQDTEDLPPAELLYSDQRWQLTQRTDEGGTSQTIRLSGPEQLSIVIHESDTSRIIIVESDKPWHEQGIRMIDFARDGAFEILTINGKEVDPNP